MNLTVHSQSLQLNPKRILCCLFFQQMIVFLILAENEVIKRRTKLDDRDADKQLFSTLGETRVLFCCRQVLPEHLIPRLVCALSLDAHIWRSFKCAAVLTDLLQNKLSR